MVHHLEDKDFYTRGCNDGASLVLSVALLCMCVALNIINYTDIWFVFLPCLHLLLAISNMIVFSGNVRARFKNRSVVIFFLIAHSLVLIASATILALLVTQPNIFLSDDCLSCTTVWAARTDEVCARTLAECGGYAKARQLVFAFFPLTAGCFVMELVNTCTYAFSLMLVTREKREGEK